MFDIHSHILFGVDDGSRTIGDSLEMLEIAGRQGVTDVVCSAHSAPNMDAYFKNFETLRYWTEKERINVRLHRGCEVLTYRSTVAREADRVAAGELSTLADSEYVLQEFDPYETVEDMLYCVKVMQERSGKKVVIAHVERCLDLWDNPEAVQALLDMGCLFQVNAYSLELESNPRTKVFARKLLAGKKVTFLGSDAHRPYHRPPRVSEGVAYIYEHCDKDYADAVCLGNARRLLIGGYTDV